MKTLPPATMIVVLMTAFGSAQAQKVPAGDSSVAEARVTEDPVPPDVAVSAVAAVAKLGDEVVLGRYQVAVDRMNPLWKERTANRMGGMDELKKKLAGVAAQMVQQGISMLSCKPQGQPLVYQVSPGMTKSRENGMESVKMIYTKWLVLVPTVTRFRIMREGNPKPMVIESTSFQVAVSDKGRNDWTFIDGAGVSVADLRELFITLPEDMKLPPVQKHEVR